jgi:RND family efflux transporter MFP subunit
LSYGFGVTARGQHRSFERLAGGEDQSSKEIQMMPNISSSQKAGFAAMAALSISLVLNACGRAESSGNPAAPLPPPVTVTTATAGEVRDWDEFTGRFEAVEHVELRPRVSGYIERIAFAEGSEVRKGDLLFAIDPRPYAAELERVEGELARAQAQSKLAASESARAQRLLAAHAISQEEHDQRLSEQSQSIANVSAAQGAVETARLNLEFTRVTAPINGRVSRAQVTAGNYVTAGATVLTSVVSLDPIYVSFDTDEQSYLRYQQNAIGAGRGADAVLVGLASESGYPHQGRVNFVDNALDPSTATIHVRAVLDNHDRRFVPGLLARVRLPGSQHYEAVLVPDAAVGTDQDRRYVLVVGGDGTVEYRSVELGAISDDRRVIRSGLKPGEQVIVSGLARARPGSKVSPQQQSAQAAGSPAAKSKPDSIAGAAG